MTNKRNHDEIKIQPEPVTQVSTIDGTSSRADRCIIAQTGTGATLWDPLAGVEITSLGNRDDSRRLNDVPVQFSFDGEQVAMASRGNDNRTRVIVVDTEDGRILQDVDMLAANLDYKIYDLCWNHDGSQLFGLFPNGIYAWTVSDGKHLRSFVAQHSFKDGHIAVSADGKELAFAGKFGRISRWQLQQRAGEN